MIVLQHTRNERNLLFKRDRAEDYFRDCLKNDFKNRPQDDRFNQSLASQFYFLVYFVKLAAEMQCKTRGHEKNEELKVIKYLMVSLYRIRRQNRKAQTKVHTP